MFPLDHEFAVDLSTHYIMLTRSYKLGLLLVNPNITFTAGLVMRLRPRLYYTSNMMMTTWE